MANSTHELFISYSRKDDDFVQKLTHKLDELAVPYWSDHKISAGHDWIDEIETAIKRASVFVLVISPSFEASKSLMFEAGIAVSRARESEAVVVPVILQGASLPLLLQRYQALHAGAMTIEEVAAQLKEVVARVHRKPERDTKELRLFISSPSDVLKERECVTRVVEELNASIGVTKGVLLRRYNWEFPRPFKTVRSQTTVNEELRKVDVFMLILAARLGTPVDVSGHSGTKEEFLMAVKSSKLIGRPQILCYLRREPVNLQSIEELEQFRKVLEFRDRLRKDRLVYEFVSLDDLEQAVRMHLTNIIVSASGHLTSS